MQPPYTNYSDKEEAGGDEEEEEEQDIFTAWYSIDNAKTNTVKEEHNLEIPDLEKRSAIIPDSEENKYTCSVCKKSYKQSCSLLVHQRL